MSLRHSSKKKKRSSAMLSMGHNSVVLTLAVESLSPCLARGIVVINLVVVVVVVIALMVAPKAAAP
jgi:hypothetical protein